MIDVIEFDHYPAGEALGMGCLRTERGNLPLHKLDVRTTITGLVSRTEIVQGFRNSHEAPLEATYVFPLPDRGAVVAMTMTADGRTIVAELKERAKARQAYGEAIASGQRASIAEEDRPDVFTMRVGNIEPGERVEVALTIVGPLPFEDGEATFRFPLVVAPRYMPGRPLSGEQAGDGWQPDTDAVPDASRISPPVLLPGFPNPVALSIAVTLDPAGLPVRAVRSSLHTVSSDDGTIRVQPGERLDRDFILRIGYGDDVAPAAALRTVPDPDGDEGTFELTVVPPQPMPGPAARDVVLLLDRSGSMGGWKMVAARRAAARIVDTLDTADRFAVRTFDNVVELPADLPAGLVPASDRHRFRAVEHLSRTDARGGTELSAPLEQGLRLLQSGKPGRDRVLVLITDGQVGNEDQILAECTRLMAGVRVHTVGIDQAVNAGFLGRLAALGGGRCELVESEDRLDDAMAAIQRRICAPLVRGLRLTGERLVDGALSPRRLPDLVSGVPLVVRGRYRGPAPALTLAGDTSDGAAWTITTEPGGASDTAVTELWARSALRDLEDRYASAPSDALEQQIVTTSLRFGVLCRFTAFVAVDSRVTNESGELHRIVQPVELPAGWRQPELLMGGAAISGMARPTAAPVAGYAQAFSSRHAGRSHPVRGPVQGKRARRAAADPAPQVDELATARTLAGAEADRLAVMPSAETDRRDALDDLATRLDALVQHLRSLGVDATALQAIVALLRDETVPSTDRWQRAAEQLRAYARSPERAAFWKGGSARR
jgi:Ca-activated chloride channel family protein